MGEKAAGLIYACTMYVSPSTSECDKSALGVLSIVPQAEKEWFWYLLGDVLFNTIYERK